MRYLLRLLFLMVWLVIPTATHAYTSNDFVMTVDTRIEGQTSSDTFQLNLFGSGYNFEIDWGDGATTSVVGSSGNISHTYATSGVKTLVIAGQIPRFGWRNYESFDCYSTSDSAKILTIEQWGTSVWDNMECAFGEARNVQITASDAPNLSNVTSMMWMFYNATAFDSDINHWDVSNIVNFHRVFEGATSFNQPLDSWDVSSGSNFAFMFLGATAFNQPLNSWTLSSVTPIDRTDQMFLGATAFNQPLNNWDMSQVDDAGNMFAGATSFNQDISSWDMSNVSNFTGMFSGATIFNQDLSVWDVSSAVYMSDMFQDSGLSKENYSNILNGWATLPSLESGVTLGAIGVTYTETATTARQYLIDTYNWTINDSGLYVEPGTETFITRWDTSLDAGSPNTVSIYADRSASAFIIDWGDGTTRNYSTGPDNYLSHTYSTPGIKTVTITGGFSSFDATCDNGPEYDKLIDVVQWGPTEWEYLNFSNCTYLESFSATDSPNLSEMTHMDMMFRDATAFNGNINNWDVSNITSMWFLFNGASSFNQPLNNWNVSSATDFGLMFTDSSFNQPLNNWDVSSADRLYGMFSGTPFNQDISSWNISNVVYLDEGQDGSEPGMFNNSDISVNNYSKIISAWSLLPLQSNLYLNIVGAISSPTSYCSSVQAARDILTGTYNWSIIDGGAVPCKTVTYTIEGSGTITGDSFQYIVDGEGGTAVTVVPASGYRFTSWSDGSTANPRTDTNLTADIAVTAILESTDDSSNKSSGTRIGVRDESLMEKISTVPVIGSIATFVINVQNFLTYLTENEEELEELTPEERTKVIIALRDIVVFLLRFIPGV